MQYYVRNKISKEAAEKKERLYDKFLAKYLKSIVVRATDVILPEDMSQTKRLDSLNLYTSTVSKWTNEIVESKTEMLNFENALNITTPKNYTEFISSTIAEYTNADIDERKDYVSRTAESMTNSGMDYESIEKFIEKEFSKESFFNKEIGEELKFKIASFSEEADNIVDEVRDEVEKNVALTEQKNQIFRKAIELIENKKDELEEKNGVKKEEDTDSDSDDGDDDDKSEESFFSLENALISGEDISNKFEFDGVSTFETDDIENVLSTSGESDDEGDDVPDPGFSDDEESAAEEGLFGKKKSKQKGGDLKKGSVDPEDIEDGEEESSEELEEGDGEDDGEETMTEEAFCKKVAPMSLNKFSVSPKINPKKLALYMLSTKDYGRSIEEKIDDRLNYINDLAEKEGIDRYDDDGALNPIYAKVNELRKSLNESNDIRNAISFDLNTIGFSKIDELSDNDNDKEFALSVVNVIEGQPAQNSVEKLISVVFRKGELEKQLRSGKNVQSCISRIGSLEEFINEELSAKQDERLEARIRALESLESSIDFSIIVEPEKLRASLDKKTLAKDKEAFEKNGEWTDTTTMFRSVVDSLSKDKTVKSSTVNVDLEYIVDCAINGKNPCVSAFEKILSKLTSSEGYKRLKPGHQYNIGKSIYTTLVTANKLGFLTERTRADLFNI